MTDRTAALALPSPFYRCVYCGQVGGLTWWDSNSGYRVPACRDLHSCTARQRVQAAARMNETEARA